MRARVLVWGLPAAVWLVFTFWYTDLAGPLGPDEIEAFASRLEGDGLSRERVADLRAFMESDTGRQFLMVNLLDLSDDPPDVPGVAPGATAEELMAHYMEHMTVELLRRACHPVFLGEAVHGALDLVGLEGASRWDAAALMRYRSRRSLMEIIAQPATRERHASKVAALTKTIAFPVEPRIHPGDPRLLLGLVLLATAAGGDAVLARRRLRRAPGVA